MISLKNKQINRQKGFTIVELLIVIVVIGILAAIVIVTFTGVQKKARNTDRKAEIGSIASQAEVYFSEAGKYPTLTEFNNPTFRNDNLKGLKGDVLYPTSGSGGLVDTGGSVNNYVYVTTPAGCDNAGTDCIGFTLTAQLEGGGEIEKTGSNNDEATPTP